jgi:hypothetical protein
VTLVGDYTTTSQVGTAGEGLHEGAMVVGVSSIKLKTLMRRDRKGKGKEGYIPSKWLTEAPVFVLDPRGRRQLS